MDVNIENVKQITSGIEDGISDAEGELLYNLAKNVPEGQVIVEIGRGKRVSTIWLAKGSAAGNMSKVYSIRSRSERPGDIEADEENTNAGFIVNLEKAGVQTIVNYSHTDSEDASRKWKEKVGLLYINTAHEYEHVKEAFLNWKRHLSPNARVVVYSSEQPGPSRVIKEYLGDLGNFTFEQRVGTSMVIRVDKCVHYWVIDSNEIGICKHCGRKRNFKRLGAEATETQNRRRQTSRKKK